MNLNDWEKLPFNGIYVKVPLKNFQINKTDYKEKGLYPVVDQGKQKIAGYTNKTPVVLNVPLIIFGDHTREVKWIDFPFVVGADGTQGLMTKKKCDLRFGFFLLQNVRLENLGYSRHFSALKEKVFLLPTLPEQKKIAEILSAWDSAIETCEKLISAKQTRKCALAQRLLTGKQRFPQFADQAWEKLGAGKVFKNISVKGFKDEQLLSATQDKGVIPRSMLEARVTMPSGNTNSFKLVEEGDFVISLRSFQGGLEYSYYRGLVSPAYTVLKPIQKINDEFYKFHFKSYDFIEHLATAVIGIRDGKQISYDDFCIVKIPYPSFEEQKRIAEVLSACDKEIELLENKRDALKQQKRGLMQKLLTGKVRVKVDAEEAMEA